MLCNSCFLRFFFFFFSNICRCFILSDFFFFLNIDVVLYGCWGNGLIFLDVACGFSMWFLKSELSDVFLKDFQAFTAPKAEGNRPGADHFELDGWGAILQSSGGEGC